MSLTQQFKDQFEEKFRDIVETEFNGSFPVENEDLAACFESVMLDDEFDEVDEAVNNGIIEWIETNKDDQIDREEKIERLEIKIESLEAELASYKEDLEYLKDGETTEDATEETWDSVTKSETW